MALRASKTAERSISGFPLHRCVAGPLWRLAEVTAKFKLKYAHTLAIHQGSAWLHQKESTTSCTQSSCAQRRTALGNSGGRERCHCSGSAVLRNLARGALFTR
jgi:hypothetical protein